MNGEVALGDEEEITWKSTDGRMVSGVLVKPVGFKPGTRYPLIVAIHGGPAAADILGFNGGYSAQVYAGAGYMVLLPNYRESTNYGEKFKIESQGDYFTKGTQDIMTGVDYLIAQGMVDSTKMGALGWSAGGHYSNWLEGHTTRFKAISSGAGVANWISMWSQSDTQRLRQWYLGDKMYWEPGQYAELVEAVADRVHQEREDADVHSRRRRRSARAASAERGDAHGALQARRAERVLGVPGPDARHSRRAQPVSEGRGRDVVDGLLRARQRQEVRVARRAEVGRETDRRWRAKRSRRRLLYRYGCSRGGGAAWGAAPYAIRAMLLARNAGLAPS